jgi:lipoprotein-releasing system ATP-binding protein
MLKATNIHKCYGALHVLKGVNLEIQEREVVAITGSSGAGKSTLLHILGTLDKPDKGEILLYNQSLLQMKGKRLAAFRNKYIGFVFQFHHLLPEFTALENVCMPAWIGNYKRKEVENEAIRLLRLIGLEARLNNKPQELSGGEQQRVAVARALINKPSLVLADEPTGNLDSKNAKELHELFLQLCKEMNQTFLIVTHNDELAAMSHRVLHMKDGVIINES